jgi:hypothetical protein
MDNFALEMPAPFGFSEFLGSFCLRVFHIGATTLR